MRKVVDPYYDKLVEDEFYSAIENRDREIEENKRLIAHQDELLALMDKALTLQKLSLNLSDRLIERNKQLSSAIKYMKDKGIDEKQIMQATGLSQEEIDNLKK